MHQKHCTGTFSCVVEQRLHPSTLAKVIDCPNVKRPFDLPGMVVVTKGTAPALSCIQRHLSSLNGFVSISSSSIKQQQQQQQQAATKLQLARRVGAVAAFKH
jgi:hypothetical protein